MDARSTLPKAACALGAAVLAACSSLPEETQRAAGLGAAQGAPLRHCAELTQAFRFADTQLDSATPVAAGTLAQAGRPVPAHCLVKGSMDRRKGADGREYAIGFEMRLPHDWNGRFYYQGNGGLDGNVVTALGALGGGPLTGALMQGFAVISSDAGHASAQNPFFGMEPQARRDHGWRATTRLTPMAKSLIASAYGKGPDRSYIGGCSTGGRHAMVAAARIGDAYDGYLVGAPGYRVPDAALLQLWGVQQWTPLMTPGATRRHPDNPNAVIPDLGSAFTAQERSTVAKAILGKCDTLDGVRDGMVHATQACQAAFDLQRDVPTCGPAGRNGQCLTPAQKGVAAGVFAGGRLPSGAVIYSSFPFDPGVSGANWAAWKFVISATLNPVSVGTVFSVPPRAVNAATEDIAERSALLSATDANHTESGRALMQPPGHEDPRNLAPLHARSARMVLFHGVSDAIFSAEDTRQWTLRVDRALQGKGQEFARLFPVPGMNHCSGGPAADQFDLLSPLVQWVEHGVPPQAVPASVRGAGNPGGVNAELPGDWSPRRTRPLCAAPTFARYKGTGDVEDASSFVCQ